MSLRSLVFVTVSLGLSVVAFGCTCSRAPGGPGMRFDAGPGADGGGRLPDGGMFVPPDGSSVNPCSSGCGPTELCGDEGHGNGLDDDCDTQVDEGCSCTPGETRPCFDGPPDRRDIGVCSDGIAVCTEFAIWSPCGDGTGAYNDDRTGFRAEVCNGADDDCNGITDDGLSGCSSSVTCPSNYSVPPLTSHTLRGASVYGGAARSWSWSIACPASVPAELCPALSNPSAQDPQVYFTASGAYRVSVTVITEDGSEANCAWTIYVRGGGLRVELNWDTMLDTAGGTDVDLHLHRWTSNTSESNFYTDDDCYWSNCQPDDELTWAGHPDSDLENCQDAPHGGGATWRARGNCRNPRLDVDTNGTDGACDGSVTDPNSDAFCAPENINVDVPVIGMPYRILVNYYSDSFSGVRATNATVNVYCGGALRGTFGRDPYVELVNGSDAGEANDNWYVADVVFFMGDCGLDCYVYPLSGVVQGTPDPSDPFGFTSIVPFGEPWSCTYDPATSTCTER